MSDQVPDHADFGYPSGQRDPALEAQARLGLALFRGDGNTIYATDFNSEFLVNDWRVTAGTIALAGTSLDGVIRGKSFISLTPEATLNRNCVIQKMFPYMDYGMLGLEATIALEPDVTQFWFQINIHDGDFKYEFYFRVDYDFSRYYIGSTYNGSPSLISFVDPIPSGDDIRVSDSGGKYYLPANVKLVIDMSSLTYDGIYFNEKTFNLIGNLPSVYIDNSPRRVSVEFGTFCANGTQKKMYIDSVFLTNNEISSRDRSEVQPITPTPYEEVTYEIPASYSQSITGTSTSSFAAARSTSAAQQGITFWYSTLIGVGASPTFDPFRVARSLISFDTSPIPDVAIVLQANIRLTPVARINNTNQNVCIVEVPLATPVTGGNREANYDAILSAASTNIVLDTVNNLALNVPVISANLSNGYINKTGITTYAFIMQRDINNQTPSPGPNYTGVGFADQSDPNPLFVPMLSVKVLQPV